MNDWEAFKEVQEQSAAAAERQKQYYDRKANAILLEPGNLVLAKADAYKGKRKVWDRWEEELYEVVCQVTKGVPSYLMMNKGTGCSPVLHPNWLFPITPAEGTPLCLGMQAEWAGCTATALEEQTTERSETMKVQQSVDCLVPAQWQTVETPLDWVIGKLCAVLWTSSRASTLD